jgi:cytochrome bd ubiquinol oxidase subunit I
VIVAGPAAIVATIAGWTTTEVGRQPWVVYGVMPTSDAVTHASGIPIGYGTLVVIYVGVVAATTWLLLRLARSPLPPGVAAGSPLAAEN